MGLTPDSEYDDLPPLGDDLYRIDDGVYRMESLDDDEDDEDDEYEDAEEDNSGKYRVTLVVAFLGCVYLDLDDPRSYPMTYVYARDRGCAKMFRQ